MSNRKNRTMVQYTIDRALDIYTTHTFTNTKRKKNKNSRIHQRFERCTQLLFALYWIFVVIQITFCISTLSRLLFSIERHNDCIMLHIRYTLYTERKNTIFFSSCTYRSNPKYKNIQIRICIFGMYVWCARVYRSQLIYRF